MIDPIQFKQLEKTLANFQNQLDRTHEPAEMGSWVDELNVAFDELMTQVEHQQKHIHAALLKEIGDGDHGKRESQVAEFEETDSQIAEFCDLVKDNIAAFSVIEASATSEIETDTACGSLEKLEMQKSELVTRGTELVAAVRSHEELINAWFAEAFVDKSEGK